MPYAIFWFFLETFWSAFVYWLFMGSYTSLCSNNRNYSLVHLSPSLCCLRLQFADFECYFCCYYCHFSYFCCGSCFFVFTAIITYYLAMLKLHICCYWNTFWKLTWPSPTVIVVFLAVPKFLYFLKENTGNVYFEYNMGRKVVNWRNAWMIRRWIANPRTKCEHSLTSF